MSDRLMLIESALRTLGVETPAVKRARRLVRDPLPAGVEVPDVPAEVHRLAVEVEAGRLDADALALRLAVLAAATDRRQDAPYALVRAAVTSLRHREASGLFAGEAGKLRRAVDGVIAGARREASAASRACTDAGVTSDRQAYASSASLAVWERRQATAARLAEVLRAERILVEQDAIMPSPPAPETPRERLAGVIRRGGRVVELDRLAG